MLITKRSPLTLKDNTREIDVTMDQLNAWANGPDVIQKVLPWLSDDDREFLLTGCTPEDWDFMFKGISAEDEIDAIAKDLEG